MLAEKFKEACEGKSGRFLNTAEVSGTFQDRNEDILCVCDSNISPARYLSQDTNAKSLLREVPVAPSR